MTTTVRIFKSKYKGFCKQCRKPFPAGTDITKSDSKGYVHAQCPTSTNGAGSSATDLTEVLAELQPETFDLEPSHYQQAIFDFVQNGSGNGVVEAVAGSGKTTTILRCLTYLPADVNAALFAFNRKIAKELARRAPGFVDVSTLHSFGFRVYRNSTKGRPVVDADKVYNLLQSIPGFELPEYDGNNGKERSTIRSLRNQMMKLVSLAKATLIDPTDAGMVWDLIDRYTLDFNGSAELAIASLPATLDACKAQRNIIDYDDMIWLPVVLGLNAKPYDWLFVDETQDLNKSQIALLKLAINEDTRIVAVGDRRQSIYGFRGADTEAIPNVIAAFNATTLPLSITYRCPTSHVDFVRQLIPSYNIEAAPGAAEGKIEHIEQMRLVSTVREGDLLMCRVNAPLVPVAFELIRNGIKANIVGRDIAKGLIDLVEKMDAGNIDSLFIKLNEYRANQIARLARRKGTEMQQEMLYDRVDTIVAVADNCDTVPEIVEQLNSIFADEAEGIALSSVHRAKGLEAKRTFILEPDLMPHPKATESWQREQEDNLIIVAYTRSKDTLFIVHPSIGG